MDFRTLRIGFLSLCCLFLTSCVGASNWLSGPAQSQTSHRDPSPHFTAIHIGITTKQEVIAQLGNPTNQYVHSIDGIQVESVSYTTSDTAVKPYQYIPFFGGLAFWKPQDNSAPSIAISFSSENRVSGLTVSTVNAHGDIRSPEKIHISDFPTSFYGMRNPEVSHSPADSPLHRP